MRRFLLLLVLLASVLGGAAAWWLNQPLPMATDSVDVSIDPRTSAQGVAQVVVRAGVDTSWQLLYAWFRLSGDARQIRAGSYEIERGTTPRGLLRKLVLGEESLRAMTLVEGWTFRQLREALATAPQLRHETAGLASIRKGAFFRTPTVMPKVRAISSCWHWPCARWTAICRQPGNTDQPTAPCRRRNRH